MRDVPVAGIDRQQAHDMIRLCEQTETTLYGLAYSPRAVRYRPGARPALERIVNDFCDQFAHVAEAVVADRDWSHG